METGNQIAKLLRLIADNLTQPYRGDIWDNAARFRLVGAGYKALYENCPEQDGFFKLESARHLYGPLKALRDMNVRRVFIIGAVQVMKSLPGDLWVPYIIEHHPRATLVLFEDDPKAKLYCSARLMDTLAAHPVISKLIANTDRHDTTNTKIKLPTMLLQVCGLNEGNVSSLSWPNIWISEAWQHKSDGLLTKAIKRADRFPDTCKILIESQPGLAGEDLEREVLQAHRVDLTWECPFCKGRQTWLTPNEFGTIRPEDFVARPIVHPPGHEDMPKAAPAPGTYSGMKFLPHEVEENGVLKALSIQERAESAWWECYWCGCAIRDTKANRRRIMDTYRQEFQIELANGKKITPKAIAFFLPFESARDNRFAKTVATYLKAKDAQRMGDNTHLRDWYLQERGVFYSESISQTVVPLVTRSVHVQGKLPDEVCRVLTADAQQDDALTAMRGQPTTGHFWVIIRAILNNGDMIQLWRGYVTSWDDLVAVQDRFEVSNENVGIDASFFTSDITDMAAARIREYTRRAKKHGRWADSNIWFTWTLLKGADKAGWKHADGYWRQYSPMQPEVREVTLKGQRVAVKVPVFLWSNPSVKDQLATLKSGGEGLVKFTALPRAQLDDATRLKEVGELTYENQMSAEHKTMGNRGRPVWEKYHGRRHNHYWDAECMALAMFKLGNYMGSVVSPCED